MVMIFVKLKDWSTSFWWARNPAEVSVWFFPESQKWVSWQFEVPAVQQGRGSMLLN
jgi:hypothetical protein